VGRVVFFFLPSILLVAVSAHAEEQSTGPDRGVRFHGLGPRIGVSIDPDQFVFGGHADFGDPLPHLTFLFPVVEIGVGSDATVTSIGTDLIFKFANRWGAWNPYLGGELAFIIASEDVPGGGDKTNTDLGLMGIFGVEKGIGPDNRFAIEMKFELADAPDFKFAALWTFGH
jgi:hypothetical protein